MIASIRLAIRLTWYGEHAAIGLFRAGRGWVISIPPIALWCWVRATSGRLHPRLQPRAGSRRKAAASLPLPDPRSPPDVE